MNLNLNIDNYGGKSVVPIMCNGMQGTAFYIGNDFLLTAFHVVSDAKFDGCDIVAIIDGKEIPCRLVEREVMDAALIQCLQPIAENLIEEIPLLSTEFKKDLDLEIIGYPQEIGNGVDYFGVSVRNKRRLSDQTLGFDVVVQRTDSFGFYSYSGFSGSPVLNEYGYAIGIVTDQLHKSLGYTSIKSIEKALEDNNIQLNHNEDEFDSRPYGIGSCIKAAEESLQKMKSRYDEDLHSEDPELEEEIKYFCGLGIKEAQKELHEKFRQWHETLPDKYKEVCNSFDKYKEYIDKGSISEEFYYDIEHIANCRNPKYQEEYLIKGHYHNMLQSLIDELQIVQDTELKGKRKFLFITGDAGYGKTHHLCHITKKLCTDVNIYLFFGTDFSKSEDPIRTIADIRQWEDTDFLKSLNDEVASKGRYAVFIIDALNEGEGTFYWKDKLPQLVARFQKYTNIKLIVSVRTMESDDELRDVFRSREWAKIELGGFRNLRNSIEKYFGVYGIYEDPDSYTKYREFARPLFLKIFCESYFMLSSESRSDLDVLLLYSLYFQKCNTRVSKWADEDPIKNVTSTLMFRIGERSLLSYYCCDIPREKAIKIANRICRNRLWSNNLYHSAIKENLLMEYGSRYGNWISTFQFDKMGDYVRTWNLLVLDKTDEERFAHLKRLLTYCQSGTLTSRERSKILNTVTVFLSVWNPAESLWKRTEFKSGLLKACLIRSLVDKNIESKRCTLKQDVVRDLLKDDDSLLNIVSVFEQFSLYRNTLMPYLHDRLMNMSMRERDEKWTIGVNKLLDSYRLSYSINSVQIATIDDVRTYIWILCWMFTSSHPNLRLRMMRIVRSLLSENTTICTELIAKFHKVNDPYVLSGLYGSIYGVLLRSRDKQFVHNISESIYKHHYENQMNVPSELECRIWTLKILEYNNTLNPDDQYWMKSQPPYKSKDNLMSYIEKEKFDDDYFGTEGGARTLRHSLFVWDFYRYTIGRNNNYESKSFIFEGKNVVLDDIVKAVAYRIKHVYGYSERLSEYDKTVEWEDRHYHSKERIGKKYQWIALGEVKAYLCDTCKMTKDWYSEEPADIPYPWYADRICHFDPTLKVFGNQLVLDNELFNYLPGESLFGLPGKEWINSRQIMPRLNIIFEDKQHCQWVILVGYQKYTQEIDGEKRESFLYYAPCLVKNIDDNAAEFASWAKERNFYGRWMPENTGNYEYLWNEYPWADSYKLLEQGEIEIWSHNAPCKIQLPYSAQLQEDRMAIDDEEVIDSTVYMPSAEFYEMFDLYNAERGIVCDSNNEVIAIHRHIPGDALDGLVIRKDILDKFLQEKNYTLFYCNLGEKQIWEGSNLKDMQRLSCCLRYGSNNDVEVIQPLTDERDFPEPPAVNNNDTFSGIDIKEWLKMEKNRSATDVLERLSQLSEYTEENNN